MSRKRESAETRKAQIVGAAAKCFQTKGYENTTIDDIAAQYGLSKGSIYWYYSSKKEIMMDFFRWWMQEMFEAMTEITLNEDSSRDAILAMGRFFIDQLKSDYRLYSTLMVIWGTAYEDDAVRQMSADLYQLYDEMIVNLLTQGEERGEFTVGDKKAIGAILMSFGDGILARQVVANDLDLDRVGQSLQEVIKAILPQPDK